MDAIFALGDAMRNAEKGLAQFTESAKVTKADSMLAFAKYAESGDITLANFGEFFATWRYGKSDATVERSHAGEMSRFKAVVAAAHDLKALDTSFMELATGIQADAKKAQELNKKDPKANAKPRQADQVIYALANRARKTDDHEAAVPEDEAFTEALYGPKASDAPLLTAIEDIHKRINNMLGDKAEKAGIAPPMDWREPLRNMRDRLEGYRDSLKNA